MANDGADLKHELKGDIAGLREQVDSIETELKSGRFENRIGDLEEELFGGSHR